MTKTSYLRRALPGLLADQSGSVLVEMSLILPVLVFMVLAVLDVGILLVQDMRVADSARSGAEYGATQSTATDLAGMQNLAFASAGSVPGYNAVAQDVCTCAPGTPAISCSSSCPAYGVPARYAQVTATATLPLVFGVRGLPLAIQVRSVARIRTILNGSN